MNPLDDMYEKIIAKSRASYSAPSKKNFGLGKQQLNEYDVQGDSLEEGLLKKYLQNKVQGYFNTLMSPSPSEYGTYNNPYTANMGGIPSNVETGGNLFAPNDVNGYYNSIGLDTSATGGAESSSGGGGVLPVLAILRAALQVRGSAGGGTDYNDTGKEKPWDQKTMGERTFSTPGTGGGAFPLWALGNLFEDDPQNPSNEFGRALNFMQEAEYKALQPLYDFFISGPSMDQRTNHITFPHGAPRGAGTTYKGIKV